MIVPTLRYRDVAAAVEWLCRVFGFEARNIVTDEAGHIRFAQLQFDSSIIMLGPIDDNAIDAVMAQPAEIGGVETQICYIYIDDAEALCERIERAGAEIILDYSGANGTSRCYNCRDPEGHIWNFGTYDPRQSGRPKKHRLRQPPRELKAGLPRFALVAFTLAAFALLELAGTVSSSVHRIDALARAGVEPSEAKSLQAVEISALPNPDGLVRDWTVEDRPGPFQHGPASTAQRDALKDVLTRPAQVPVGDVGYGHPIEAASYSIDGTRPIGADPVGASPRPAGQSGDQSGRLGNDSLAAIAPSDNGNSKQDCVQNQDADLKIRGCSEIISRGGNVAWAYNNRGYAYHVKGQSYRAIDNFTTAIERNPRLAQAYSNRGYVYASRKDYDRAIADYTKVIALEPTRAQAYAFRGHSHSARGHLELAIADYSAAIERDPKNAAAYGQRVLALTKPASTAESPAGAGKHIELRLDRTDPSPARAAVLETPGRRETAITDILPPLHADSSRQGGKDALQRLGALP